MPRKFVTVLLELRVTYTIMHAKHFVLAPLPVEESDVESAPEDVQPTKAESAETNDEPADSTMKDKEDEEDDDDGEEEDPETSVWALMDCCILLTMAQLHCRSHQGPPLRLRRCERSLNVRTIANRLLI